MIHATRLKPVVVGAASTTLPYFCTKPCRIRSSLSPRFMAAINSVRILSDDGQPTWLHSSNTWPQPQVHISLCPRLLKRALLSPAPSSRNASIATNINCRPTRQLFTCIIRVRISHLLPPDRRRSPLAGRPVPAPATSPSAAPPAHSAPAQ